MTQRTRPQRCAGDELDIRKYQGQNRCDFQRALGAQRAGAGAGAGPPHDGREHPGEDG